MKSAIDIAAIADLTVQRWVSSGRLPETSFDFRWLIADGIAFALSETGHPAGLAWVQNVCGSQVDAPRSTGASRSPAGLPRTAADLGHALLQMHALHESRNALMPSPELERLNTFAGKLAHYIDSARTGRELMTLLNNLESAFDLASKGTMLAKADAPDPGLFRAADAGQEVITLIDENAAPNAATQAPAGQE